MLRKPGARRGPRSQAGLGEKKVSTTASASSDGADGKTHRATVGRGAAGADDEPLLLDDIEIDDDFNLLEDSPDGGKTFYSGGRDETGQRETVRWEGVGLIKTPRTRQRTAFSRGDSCELLCPNPVERAVRGGLAAEAGKSSRPRPAGTVLRRQRSLPAGYRELRAMKVMNQPADVKKHCQKWRADCETELDQLKKQWVAYQSTARRGKPRARKAWCKSQPDADLAHATQHFSKGALRERQVQSPVEVMPSPGKRQKMLERPVARELFHVTPLAQTSPPDGEGGRCHTRRSMDSVALSPAPDFLLEEALAIASRFSDKDKPQGMGASRMQRPLDRNPAAGRLLGKEGSKCPSGDSQKGKTPRRSDGPGRDSQLPTGSRTSPLRTPRGRTAPNRVPKTSTRPPKTPGMATPRGSRPASNSKAPLGPPSRVPRKSRAADPHSQLKTARPLAPAQRTTPKQRPSSVAGLPAREASGLGACTPRSEASSTPRGTPRSLRRPQQPPPESRLRKGGPLGRAMPSPRPGLGPASRLGATQASAQALRKVCTPRESGSCAPSKLASRPSPGPPQRLLKVAAASVGTRATRGKGAAALPHALPSARRQRQ